MKRFFPSLRPLIRFVARYPLVVVVAAALCTILGLSGAQHLRINPDFAELLPSHYPSVQALERLREHVGGASESAVAIVSPSAEANRAFAEAFIPQAMSETIPGSAEPLFTRYEYRKDVDFIKDNALYFASSSELDEIEAYLEEQREEAVLEENPFFFDLDDEDNSADGESDGRVEALRSIYDKLVQEEYPESDDSTTLVLRLYPSGSQSDIGFIDDLYQTLDSLAVALQPTSYHPEMEVVLAGRLLRSLVEVRAITDDLVSSLGAGILAVLLVVVGYFLMKALQAQRGTPWSAARVVATLARLPAIAFIVAVPLLMSLSWTFGVAFAVYEELNLMTTTLGLVLFGLGIDFGIHFYARYSEERRAGRSAAQAVETTFLSTGQAITVGALSTAAALYSLLLADFRGFSEFGFIAGTGVLFAVISMTLVLPAFLLLFERYRLLNMSGGQAVQPDRSTRRFPTPRAVVGVSVALVAASLLHVPPPFEYEFGRLEPEYTEYNERRDVVSRVYDNRDRRNPAYVITDTPEEIPAVLDALRAQMADSNTTIGEIESLQERFPAKTAVQQAKLARIAAIREDIDDPRIDSEGNQDIERLRRAAQTTTPIPEDEVPEFLKAAFTSKSGEIGNFVVIYPRYGLSDGRQSIAFADEVGTFTTDAGDTYNAGSTSIVAADMLQLMRREAPWMVALTFAVVVVLMIINFGSVRWAALAVVPLVVGIMWMLLLVGLFGMKLNFYNLIVLPAVLGIGNDAGVHIVHRYREHGAGSIMKVLRTTGEHITVGALTTMIGFGGPLLSFHPGLRSIGELAVIGIGATLIAAIAFLPALVDMLERRRQQQATGG